MCFKAPPKSLYFCLNSAKSYKNTLDGALFLKKNSLNIFKRLTMKG